MSAEAIQESPESAVWAEPYAEARAMVECDFVGTESWNRLNELDAVIEAHPEAVRDFPLNHIFTPGLYCRQIFMPAGTLLTTRVHLTEHPYFIVAGVVSVWDDEHGAVTLRAHHAGITKPGTRRVLFVHEDCLWMTCHANPNNETDPDKIVEAVTFDHRKLRPSQ